MIFESLDRETLKKNLFLIVDLYQKCLPGNLDEEYFKWRYIENPIGDILFNIAKDGTKIVASYSASPCLISYDGKVFKSALSLNTMTHPHYQRQGLFVKLASKLYNMMAERGYKMIWGFPNNISNRTFNSKLHWKTIYEVPTLTLDIDSIKSWDKTILNEDNSFELNYDATNIENSERIHVVKDKEYLIWRYSKNPNNKYINFVINNQKDVEGYIICKEYNEILNIIDIFFTDVNQINILINAAITYAKKINKREVTIWAPINSELHTYLEKRCFKNDYPIRYFGGKVLDKDNNFNKFLNYNNWFINAGDNNEY